MLHHLASVLHAGRARRARAHDPAPPGPAGGADEPAGRSGAGLWTARPTGDRPPGRGPARGPAVGPGGARLQLRASRWSATSPLPGASANMAWAGHCAFVATTGTGINVDRRVRPTEPGGHDDAARSRLGPDDRDARGEADRIARRARRGALRARLGRARHRADGHLRRVGLRPPAVPHDLHLPGQHPQPHDLARRQPRVRHVAAAGRRHPRSGPPRVPRQPRGRHPPAERPPAGRTAGELPGPRGPDEPGWEHPLPGRTDAAVRLVHDRRHHRLAGSQAEGAESGQGTRPLRPLGDDQRSEVRAPLRGEHRRADREGMRARRT